MTLDLPIHSNFASPAKMSYFILTSIHIPILKT